MIKGAVWIAAGLMGCAVFFGGGRPVLAGAVPDDTPGDRGALTSLADLKSRRIAVVLGSAQDIFAAKTYPRATILRYNSPSDIVLAVTSGTADVALYDSEPLREILRRDPELGILGESLFSVPVGAGFRREHQELRDQFNEFLKLIRRNGVYADMVNRWMKQGDLRMPEIPAASAKGVLVIGVVSDIGAPFSLMKDTHLVGFDIELSRRFAAFLGRAPRLVDMVFGSLIPAVASGKIDMIASSMSITEERKKEIIFSEPYYEMGSNALALKKNIALAGAKSTAPSLPRTLFNGIIAGVRSNIIQEQRYLLIWDGLKTTIVISVLATLFGTLLGGVVCFMRMSQYPLLHLPARMYIFLVRGTPLLVLLMLIFYVVFASVNIDPVLVAVIAFGINFAAYVAEIFRSGVEGVERGQTEAGLAMGFSRVATFSHIVLPQTVQRIFPVFKGEFISLVKMTSIVGYIAVQDLTKAGDIIRSRTFDAFFPLIMVALLYFAITWALMLAMEYLERIANPTAGRTRKGSR